MCPGPASNGCYAPQGSCDPLTGTCTCSTSFTGPDCNKKLCPGETASDAVAEGFTVAVKTNPAVSAGTAGAVYLTIHMDRHSGTSLLQQGFKSGHIDTTTLEISSIMLEATIRSIELEMASTDTWMPETLSILHMGKLAVFNIAPVLTAKYGNMQGLGRPLLGRAKFVPEGSALWQEHPNKHCSSGRVSSISYSTLAAAQAVCKRMAACRGVYDPLCDQTGNYYLCKEPRALPLALTLTLTLTLTCQPHR